MKIDNPITGTIVLILAIVLPWGFAFSDGVSELSLLKIIVPAAITIGAVRWYVKEMKNYKENK